MSSSNANASTRSRAALAIRVDALPMESAPGFLLRAFEVNGEPWSRERLGGKGIILSNLMLGGGARIAAEMTGIDRSRFASTTADVRSKKVVVVGGEELHRDDWSTQARRWCPACFRADLDDTTLGGRTKGWRAHRRFWWDATCVLTCPDHHALLLSECPMCWKAVTYEGGSLTTCVDGHSLLKCEAVTVEEADVRADKYVLGRLGARGRHPVPFLDSMPLRDAHDVLERLGCAAVGGARGAFSKFPVERQPEVLSAGFEIAMDWPQAFDDLLDRLVAAQAVEVGSAGADHVYGYLVMWARSVAQKPHGRAILDKIHAHQARRTSLRADWAASAFAGEDSPRSLAQLSEATGRTSSTMAAYLKALGHWPANSRSGSFIAIPRHVYDDLVELCADAVGMSTLAELLGTDDIRARALVEAGLLTASPLHGKAGKIPLYSKCQTLSWMERLASDAPTVEIVTAPLTSVLQANRFAKVGGLPGVVKLILSGDVPVRGRLSDTVGLNAVLIDPADIERIRFRDAGVTHGIKAAAKLLGVHLETASACVAAELLPKAMVGKQKIGVTQEAIDDFKATYVTAKELAEPLGTLNRYVITVLGAAGIEAVLSTADNPRTRVTVYRRADIPSDLAARYREMYPPRPVDRRERTLLLEHEHGTEPNCHPNT